MSPVTIDIQNYGLYATHNLMCWLCGENKAVYNMHPVWAFQPCGECEQSIEGQLTRTRKWWKR